MCVKNAKFLQRLHSKVVSKSSQCVRVGEPLTQAVLLVPHSESQGAPDREVGGKLFLVIAQVGQKFLELVSLSKQKNINNNLEDSSCLLVPHPPWPEEERVQVQGARVILAEVDTVPEYRCQGEQGAGGLKYLATTYRGHCGTG